MSDLIDKLKILLVLLHDHYEYWRGNIWRADLDEHYCCDGRDCGCGGATIRELYLTPPHQLPQR